MIEQVPTPPWHSAVSHPPLCQTTMSEPAGSPGRRAPNRQDYVLPTQAVREEDIISVVEKVTCSMHTVRLLLRPVC
jgi:hypothetical protein